ncbi:MAG TPA: AAA family ATPase [Caulobacter sp.]|nr:AAA family ATPase [Caulobacter sp.]
MKTLAILSRKGGTGKTTLAIHLAVAAQADGRRTLLADTDRQHSALEWRRERRDATPIVEAVKPGALFARQQEARRAGFNLMVVDTGPSVEEEVEQAVRCADVCLVVARPNFFDIRAVAESAALADRFHRPVAFVLNQAPHRRESIEAPVLMESVKALRGLGFPVLPIGLRSRAAYQAAAASGRAAQEFDPDGTAGSEMTALWRHVSDRLWPAPVRAVTETAYRPTPVFQAAPTRP